MIKENGRKERPDKKDYASKTGKKMKCSRCGAVEFKKGIEFGEEERCSDCGGHLRELQYN